jgi:hypothetical protein
MRLIRWKVAVMTKDDKHIKPDLIAELGGLAAMGATLVAILILFFFHGM